MLFLTICSSFLQANIHAILSSEAQVDRLIGDIDSTLEALSEIEITVQSYETVLKVGDKEREREREREKREKRESVCLCEEEKIEGKGIEVAVKFKSNCLFYMHSH